MRLRRTIVGLSVALAISNAGAHLVRADETVTQDVTVTIADAGAFTVSLRAVDGSDPTFGTVGVDAVTDHVASQAFVLEYTDTYIERGAGDVMLAIASFEPDSPVPPFLGSDQADFQIPNRYLTLSEVGEVETAPDGPNCSAGPIAAVHSVEGQSFDLGQPRTVATVAAGCGVGSASQPIELTLTVPAGVYPTTYSAAVTIETAVESTAP